MPFQKGPCGEGGRMRGFLLPLLEAAVVVLFLVLLLIFFEFSPLFSQHQSKQICLAFLKTKRDPRGHGRRSKSRTQEQHTEHQHNKMSAFFRAKKKMVSLAGGSGAGRKIIKSNLGDDGVILLRILKTVTLKLYGNKKQSRLLKKSIMKYAVKGGYLYKQNKLTASDAKGMSLPMERLFKHAIDATESDGEMETTTMTTEAAGESKSGSSATTTTTTEHQESDDDDDDAESDDDVDVPVSAASSSTTVVVTAPPHLLPHVIGMSNNLKVSFQVFGVCWSVEERERERERKREKRE